MALGLDRITVLVMYHEGVFAKLLSTFDIKFHSRSELEPLSEPHCCLMAIRVLPVERRGGGGGLQSRGSN
jgi:hypothetical protein